MENEELSVFLVQLLCAQDVESAIKRRVSLPIIKKPAQIAAKRRASLPSLITRNFDNFFRKFEIMIPLLSEQKEFERVLSDKGLTVAIRQADHYRVKTITNAIYAAKNSSNLQNRLYNVLISLHTRELCLSYFVDRKNYKNLFVDLFQAAVESVSGVKISGKPHYKTMMAFNVLLNYVIDNLSEFKAIKNLDNEEEYSSSGESCVSVESEEESDNNIDFQSSFEDVLELLFKSLKKANYDILKGKKWLEKYFTEDRKASYIDELDVNVESAMKVAIKRSSSNQPSSFCNIL